MANYDPDLDPILQAINARFDGIEARLAALETGTPKPADPKPADPKPEPEPPAPDPVGDYQRVGDFKVDWNRSFRWGSFDFYLPEHVGPKSFGVLENTIRNADGTVTLKAGFGAADPRTGRNWRTGALQGQGVLKHAKGRIGAIVHATKPNAVAALFGYANSNAKEIDFELTKYGTAGWSPTVHMPKTGGGRGSSTKRQMRRAPWADKPQRLEYDLRDDRCDFYCDGVIFETITPADMADGCIWDTTTPMELFLSVEYHDAWAGWQKADYDKGAEMVVHAVAPGAAITAGGTPLPPPNPNPTEDSAPRTINGLNWTFTEGQGAIAGVAEDGETILLAKKGTGDPSAKATFATVPGVPHRLTYAVQGYVVVTGGGSGWAGHSSGSYTREWTPTGDSASITATTSRPDVSRLTSVKVEPLG